MYSMASMNQDDVSLVIVFHWDTLVLIVSFEVVRQSEETFSKAVMPRASSMSLRAA